MVGTRRTAAEAGSPDHDGGEEAGGTIAPHWSLGRLEEAVDAYNAALRLQAADAEVHADLATALQQLARFDQAISHFREAARLEP